MTAHSHPIEGHGDWIEWSGGKCPVEPKTIVQVRLRGGEHRDEDEAQYFRWWHANPDQASAQYDTIAYRVVSK